MFNPYYLPKADPPLIGAGYPIVLLGWSPRKQFASISCKHYAAMGQLYSLSGVGYLFRNLLANPSYRDLVIYRGSPLDRSPDTGTTRLLSWWQSPIDNSCWSDIDTEALIEMRSHTNLHIAYTKKELLEILESIEPRPATREPLFFPPPPPPEIQSFGTPWGHTIVADSIEDAWHEVVHRIEQCGRTVIGIREILGVSVIVRSPISSREYEHYYRQILESSKIQDGSYSYGDRIREYGRDSFDQLSWVIQRLSENPTSKQVVMNLWLPGVDTQEGVFPPCLNHIWFRKEEGRLGAIATFRSHDIAKAWIKNAHGLTRLLEAVARQIGLDVGILQINSHSAHIYIEDLASLPKYKQSFIEDGAGNYVVSKGDGGAIAVTLLSQEGEPLKAYEGQGESLLLRVLQDNPSISPRHAAYLGLEIGGMKDCT